MTGRRTLTEAERQASDWIVRMNGDPTAAERAQFETWLAADRANAQAYEALKRTWSKIAGNPALKGLAAANDAATRSRNWARPALAIAASALLAIGALYWFTRAPTAPAEHYATNPAEVRTIELADGSTIVLSGATEASVSFDDNERRVELGEGYALFDVQHDPSRPFIVHTPQGDIRVLGTSFVVRVGETQVRTTVIRGRVSGAAERSGLLRVLGAREPVTAQANEEIIFNAEGASIVPIAAEVIPRRLAWQDHMLAFDGETLNEAIAEVSRQTGWRFELADADLGELRVGGYVSAEPQAFIELMSSSLGLEARAAGERHVVLSQRPAP